METQFDLGNGVTLILQGQRRQGPNEVHSWDDLKKCVSLQLIYSPQIPDPIGAESTAAKIYATVTPSYARAIASALLSAATEAR